MHVLVARQAQGGEILWARPQRRSRRQPRIRKSRAISNRTRSLEDKEEDEGKKKNREGRPATAKECGLITSVEAKMMSTDVMSGWLHSKTMAYVRYLSQVVELSGDTTWKMASAKRVCRVEEEEQERRGDYDVT